MPTQNKLERKVWLQIMKKENRQKAKELRAKQRAKKARQAALKRAGLIAIPVVIVLLVLILAFNNSDRSTNGTQANTSTDTSSESTADISSEENTTPTLNKDSSLKVEDGDLVNIDYVGTVDGVEFQGGNTLGEGADLQIGSHTYIDDFEEQLIGHNVGDTVKVKVTFPKNYGNDQLNGKDAVFKTVINGIYNK